jgi:hypothetical protein
MDARLHILSLPKSEHDTTAWQVAIEALLLAAGVSDAEIDDHEAAAQAGAGSMIRKTAGVNRRPSPFLVRMHPRQRMRGSSSR